MSTRLPVIAADIDFGPQAEARTRADDDAFDALVELEVINQRVRREARRRLDAEERGPVPPLDIATLRERLERPRSIVQHRIAGWQPQNGRVVLAAQFKAG